MANSSTKEILRMYRTKPESFWLAEKTRTWMHAFQRMSKEVRAYQKFLKIHNINPRKVKKESDLAKIPHICKKNYFYQFPLGQVLRRGCITKQPTVVTSTSGTTGIPTYFFRDESVDWQYSILAEYFLNNSPKGTTLLIDCFGMGVWIGGLITYQAFRYAALRGCPVTIITPGINKGEILYALKKLAPEFDNVILSGYPPFIKDIIDESIDCGVNFRKFRTRLLFAAEGFTESFRDYVAAKAHVRNIYYDTLNIYGSAEFGAMAFETPTSIFIRRLAMKHPAVRTRMFRPDKTPTLAQYNPSFVSFDEFDHQVSLSADSAVPLFNYQIGDNGGTFTLSKIEEIFKSAGINLRKEAAKDKIILLPLPFVYVYERSDLSASFYGLLIYPETIKEVLITKPMNKFLTGKFVMEVKYDSKNNQRLEINLELRKGRKISISAKKLILSKVVSQLMAKNSEYRELSRFLHNRAVPHLIFWPAEHPIHFRAGVKQKWVKIR